MGCVYRQYHQFVWLWHWYLWVVALKVTRTQWNKLFYCTVVVNSHMINSCFLTVIVILGINWHLPFGFSFYFYYCQFSAGLRGVFNCRLRRCIFIWWTFQWLFWLILSHPSLLKNWGSKGLLPIKCWLKWQLSVWCHNRTLFSIWFIKTNQL